MARKITAQAVDAFIYGDKFSKANTKCDGNAMFLHGNKIAEFRDGEMFVTTAGWNTVTTKERLNGLPGVSVYTRKHQLYLNGHKWSGDMVQVSTFEGDV